MYTYMRDRNLKVVAHPYQIRDIPRYVLKVGSLYIKNICREWVEDIGVFCV